jgi:hypothetical protein
LMPIVVFVVIAIVLQGVNLLFTLGIEKYVSTGASVTVFALLYMVVFWIAWKITVWVIDSRLRPIPKVDQQKLVTVLFTVAQLPMLA